jgi:hypothetical protein
MNLSDPYGDRVRALEIELDIPTTDAQAMVDAEDMIQEQQS